MSEQITARMSQAFFLVKLACFAACLALFTWKVADSVATLDKKATGTKVDVLPIGELPVPMVAACRHPYQVFALWNRNRTKNTYDEYGLTTESMQTASAYQAIEDLNESYDSIFREYLFDDLHSVLQVKVSMNGEDLDGGTYYHPVEDPGLWETRFHPLYGNCYVFPVPHVVAAYEQGGIRSVMVTINLWAAFPPSPERTPPTTTSTTSTTATTTTTLTTPTAPNPFAWPNEQPAPENGTSRRTKRLVVHPLSEVQLWGTGYKFDAGKVFHNHSSEYTERMYEKGFGAVPVFIFQNGSILISKNIANLNFHSSETYYTNFELIDKSDIKEVAKCEDDPDYNEDHCLHRCLVDKFIIKFGCIHSRLKLIDVGRDAQMPNDIPDCTFKHLNETQPLDDYDILFALEPGLKFIRKQLVKFDNTRDLAGRCNCAEPCRRLRIVLSRWDRSPSTFGLEFANNHALFHFSTEFKVYMFHMLYTADNFLADVGGYLGLFLGLSCFGLVELLETAIMFRAKRGEEKRVENVDSKDEKEKGRQRETAYKMHA